MINQDTIKHKLSKRTVTALQRIERLKTVYSVEIISVTDGNIKFCTFQSKDGHRWVTTVQLKEIVDDTFQYEVILELSTGLRQYKFSITRGVVLEQLLDLLLALYYVNGSKTIAKVLRQYRMSCISMIDIETQQGYKFNLPKETAVIAMRIGLISFVNAKLCSEPRAKIGETIKVIKE